MASTNKKSNAMLIIGIISLIGLLSYTWIHTSNLLASYVNPPLIGFLAAAGIELSIVGLSMRIGELHRAGLNAKFFWVTLVFVVVVSALANIAEGYLVKFGEPLMVSNIGKLDLVQGVVSFAATGLISLVTLALSELVGQDVSTAVKAAHRKEVREDNVWELVGENPQLPTELTSALPEPNPLQVEAPKTDGRIVVNGFEDFRAHMLKMNGSAPKNGSQVVKTFHLSPKTGYKYWDRWVSESTKESTR